MVDKKLYIQKIQNMYVEIQCIKVYLSEEIQNIYVEMQCIKIYLSE
jgi:hypothetical protein